MIHEVLYDDSKRKVMIEEFSQATSMRAKHANAYFDALLLVDVM